MEFVGMIFREPWVLLYVGISHSAAITADTTQQEEQPFTVAYTSV
jgi:hypothetical protein